jgi:hypothetical protein
VPTLLQIGVTEELLLRCGLAMHIPLRPMLGGITRDLGEMLTKLSGREFTCEYKYDGTIHHYLIFSPPTLLTKCRRPASTSSLRLFRQSNDLLPPS